MACDFPNPLPKPVIIEGVNYETLTFWVDYMHLCAYKRVKEMSQLLGDTIMKRSLDRVYTICTGAMDLQLPQGAFDLIIPLIKSRKDYDPMTLPSHLKYFFV